MSRVDYCKNDNGVGDFNQFDRVEINTDLYRIRNITPHTNPKAIEMVKKTPTEHFDHGIFIIGQWKRPSLKIG